MPDREARPTGVRTRTRDVLTIVAAWHGESMDVALFERHDSNGRRRTVGIEHTAWHEMGRPEKITVTIEPGDQLST